MTFRFLCSHLQRKPLPLRLHSGNPCKKYTIIFMIVLRSQIHEHLSMAAMLQKNNCMHILSVFQVWRANIKRWCPNFRFLRVAACRLVCFLEADDEERSPTNFGARLTSTARARPEQSHFPATLACQTLNTLMSHTLSLQCVRHWQVTV